jgi:hypothetical protein
MAPHPRDNDFDAALVRFFLFNPNDKDGIWYCRQTC